MDRALALVAVGASTEWPPVGAYASTISALCGHASKSELTVGLIRTRQRSARKNDP